MSRFFVVHYSSWNPLLRTKHPQHLHSIPLCSSYAQQNIKRYFGFRISWGASLLLCFINGMVKRRRAVIKKSTSSKYLTHLLFLLSFIQLPYLPFSFLDSLFPSFSKSTEYISWDLCPLVPCWFPPSPTPFSCAKVSENFFLKVPQN